MPDWIGVFTLAPDFFIQPKLSAVHAPKVTEVAMFLLDFDRALFFLNPFYVYFLILRGEG